MPRYRHTPTDLESIRSRNAAATPGPWVWDGNVRTKSLGLVTQHSGKLWIMTFDRWGMNGAQPSFREVPPEAKYGTIVKASERPIFEVCPEATDAGDPRVYRHDVVGIRNPEADFIAHSKEDVEFLLALVDQQAARIADLELVPA